MPGHEVRSCNDKWRILGVNQDFHLVIGARELYLSGLSHLIVGDR